MSVEQASLECLYEHFVASSGVQTDSRKVALGEMFFALKGDNFDGNRYASQALEAGAKVAVVDDEGVVADDRYLLVDDVLTALQGLAHYHRQRLSAPVLAITGTNGKTTTKELTAAVLGRKFRTHYTQGNLNNHIGVPLTLLSVPSDAEFVIVEMGASSRGEIRLLAEIAAPDYGLITNIGRAHLEGFGGEEGVRKGKGELYDYLCAHNDVALFRSDDEVLASMAAERKGLCAEGYESSLAEGFVSNLVGDYNRFNIAAAVAVGRHFGVAEEDIASAIAGYEPRNNRSQSMQTTCNLLTVDCYNANPSSMVAAIANFHSTSHAEFSHKMMILGDMLELGEWSESEHLRVLEEALAGEAKVVVVGRNFSSVAGSFESVVSFPSTAEAAEWLKENAPTRTFILVKGSRGIGLEKLLPLL